MTRIAAVLFAVAGMLITGGVALISPPAGLIVLGVLLIVWTAVVVLEV